MAELDPNIALAAQNPVKLQSPLEAQQQVLTLKQLALQGQLGQATLEDRTRALNEQRQLAQVYQSNVAPDGTPNHAAIIQGMADRGLGHLIPQYRKTMLDANKDQADVDTKQFDLAKKRLDASGATISSLLQMPQVSHDDVIKAVSGMVNIGTMDQNHGAQLVRSMPGDPASLRGWLTQKGLEVMDASKRMDLLTPKFEKIDNGGAIQMGTVDQLTGKFTPGQAIKKVATPDAELSSRTQLTTTGMNNATSRRGQDLTFQTANVVPEQTPTGIVMVNKQNRTSAPVLAADGSQVQQVKSPLWESTQRNAKMSELIKEARTLLPKATGSGVGAMIDSGLGQVGVATPGAEAAGQLEAIGGWLTSNVPRMEGPQSDKDTQLYGRMAAQVADRTVPTSVRLKSLETLETLQDKYKNLNTMSTPKVGPNGNVRPPLSAFGGR